VIANDVIVAVVERKTLENLANSLSDAFHFFGAAIGHHDEST
jgi:hypothetical protein